MPKPPSCVDYRFTQHKEMCSLVENEYGVSPALRFRPQRWSGPLGLATVALLAPDWDGLSFSKGRDFRANMIRHLAPGFLGGADADDVSAAAVGALCSAIGRIGNDFPEPEARARLIKKTLNACLLAAQQAFSDKPAGCGNPRAAIPILSALIQQTDPATRASAAWLLLKPSRLLNARWQPSQPEVLRDLYAALFSAGCGVHDVFGLKRAEPGAVCGQLASALRSMPEGPIKAFFISVVERESLSLSLGGAPGEGSAGPEAADAHTAPKHNKIRL